MLVSRLVVGHIDGPARLESVMAKSLIFRTDRDVKWTIPRQGSATDAGAFFATNFIWQQSRARDTVRGHLDKQ